MINLCDYVNILQTLVYEHKNKIILTKLFEILVWFHKARGSHFTRCFIFFIVLFYKGLQKARGPRPTLSPARPDGLKPGPSPFLGGPGRPVGPRFGPPLFKKNYKKPAGLPARGLIGRAAGLAF